MNDQFVFTVNQIFLTRRKYAFILFVVFFSIFLVGIVGESVLTRLYVYLAFFAMVGLFVRWIQLGWYVRQNIWNIFIAKNNVRILPSAERPIMGILTDLGDSYSAKVDFEGIYNGIHIRNMSVKVDYSNSRAWLTRSPVDGIYSFRVLEIITNKNYHHVFLDSKRNNRFGGIQMRTLHAAIKGNPKIKTDGDTSHYFNAYVPPHSSFKGLITLTPDVLLILRDLAKPFDVEFIDNSIYIITDERLKKVKDIMLYQEQIIRLVSALGDDLVRRPDVQELPMRINKYKALFV